MKEDVLLLAEEDKSHNDSNKVKETELDWKCVVA